MGSGKYVGGFPDGLWEWRYKKTTLKCSYEAGVVEGACMMLVDGRMTEWGQYASGLRHGLQVEFVAEGDRVVQSWQEGQLEGKRMEYEEGMLRQVESYRAGTLHGLYVEYDKDGEIVTKGEYLDGERVGDWYKREK